MACRGAVRAGQVAKVRAGSGAVGAIPPGSVLRLRPDQNLLHRKEYLLRVTRRTN